jgi:hypothetical protein
VQPGLPHSWYRGCLNSQFNWCWQIGHRACGAAHPARRHRALDIGIGRPRLARLSLLIGSIPGIIVGSLLASRISDRVLGPILAVVLALVRVRLLF